MFIENQVFSVLWALEEFCSILNDLSKEFSVWSCIFVWSCYHSLPYLFDFLNKDVCPRLQKLSINFFFSCAVQLDILVPWPGIEPRPSTVKSTIQSPGNSQCWFFRCCSPHHLNHFSPISPNESLQIYIVTHFTEFRSPQTGCQSFGSRKR